MLFYNDTKGGIDINQMLGHYSYRAPTIFFMLLDVAALNSW